MEISQAIHARRSIRLYQNKPVEEQKLYQLIDAARMAPSAKNRQPWRFIIETDASRKKQISEIMKSFFKEGMEYPEYVKTINLSARIINRAPAVIWVLKERDVQWNTSDLLSIGAAIENMCLTAVDKGLGTVWLRDVCYTQAELEKYIGTQLEIVSCVAVGYPAEQPDMRPRKAIEELVLEQLGDH